MKILIEVEFNHDVAFCTFGNNLVGYLELVIDS